MVIDDIIIDQMCFIQIAIKCADISCRCQAAIKTILADIKKNMDATEKDIGAEVMEIAQETADSSSNEVFETVGQVRTGKLC